MRERKNIKLRVDMNDDTKFKIIDRKPERDLIYCIWIKLLLLAGKVNKEGELHLSGSIPYTIETLSIEFNRDVEQVKLALDVFLELEMIEFTKHNVYRVKNFVKHQSIKVKEQNDELDVRVENKAVNNGEAIEEDLKVDSQSVEKDRENDNKQLNTEEVVEKKIEIQTDINKNQINDTKIVDKRKKSNSKKKNQIFKDGFQDIKEKHIEVVECIGEYKPEKGDKVIIEFDCS